MRLKHLLISLPIGSGVPTWAGPDRPAFAPDTTGPVRTEAIALKDTSQPDGAERLEYEIRMHTGANADPKPQYIDKHRDAHYPDKSAWPTNSPPGNGCGHWLLSGTEPAPRCTTGTPVCVDHYDGAITKICMKEASSHDACCIPTTCNRWECQSDDPGDSCSKYRDSDLTRWKYCIMRRKEDAHHRK